MNSLTMIKDKEFLNSMRRFIGTEATKLQLHVSEPEPGFISFLFQKSDYISGVLLNPIAISSIPSHPILAPLSVNRNQHTIIKYINT